jgi:hypothetical protein
MQWVCPKCQGTFHGQLLCPQCGVQMQEKGPPSAAATAVAPPRHVPPIAAQSADRPMQLTVLTRLLIGLVLAQGLYYGARHFGQAILLGQGQPDWWDGFPGLVTVQALQAGALLIGGVVAGAGHARGLIPGALLGVINACLILLVESLFGRPAAPQMGVILPLVHAGVGALGGLVGARIWRPWPSVPTHLPDAEAPGRFLRAVDLASEPPAAAPVPWAWGRLLLGAVLAAAGFCFNDKVRDFVTANGVAVPGGLQGQLVTWEIAVLGVVLGGGLAGATTGRGFSQGLAAGLLAAPAVLAVHLNRGGDYLPGQEFIANISNLPLGPPRLSAPLLAYLLTHVVLLASLCGWFAGQLLPPLRESGRIRGDLPD